METSKKHLKFIEYIVQDATKTDTEINEEQNVNNLYKLKKQKELQIKTKVQTSIHDKWINDLKKNAEKEKDRRERKTKFERFLAAMRRD